MKKASEMIFTCFSTLKNNNKQHTSFKFFFQLTTKAKDGFLPALT